MPHGALGLPKAQAQQQSTGAGGQRAHACLTLRPFPLPSQLSSCDPNYGLCKEVPGETFEVSAHEGLAELTPAGKPRTRWRLRPRLCNPRNDPRDDSWTVDLVNGTGSCVSVAPVHEAAVVYMLNKTAMLTYDEAEQACRCAPLHSAGWPLPYPAAAAVAQHTSVLVHAFGRCVGSIGTQHAYDCLPVASVIRECRVLAMQVADAAGHVLGADPAGGRARLRGVAAGPQ